jgi:hypothetical protein
LKKEGGENDHLPYPLFAKEGVAEGRGSSREAAAEGWEWLDKRKKLIHPSGLFQTVEE